MSTITLRTKTGARFGWLDESPTLAPVRNAGDEYSIFPPFRDLPDPSRLEATGEAVREADDPLDALQARAGFDAAAETLVDELDLLREINALLDDVTADALDACAHEWLG